ncbi:unnamed protein product, partial [Rotaria socialis]
EKLDLSVTDALSYGSDESSYLQHRNIDHLTYTSLQSISESFGLLPLDSSSSIISLSYQIEKAFESFELFSSDSSSLIISSS